jgi:SAM-dependent methyltransferase
VSTQRPDWQLPAGVDRGLWEYLHDPAIAQNYDQQLAGTPLLDLDVRWLRAWCPTPGAVIDLGCGTGRVACALTPLGYEVLSVDLAHEMLCVLRAKAQAAQIAAPAIRVNLVELDAVRSAQFDYAACLFSTLGMIRTAAARQRCLAHVARILKPGGRLVLHVHNYWFNARSAAGRAWLLRDLLTGASGDRTMPAHVGVSPITLHHFTRTSAQRALRAAGLSVRAVRPVSTHADGRLPWAWWAARWRAYGFFLVAEKNARAVGAPLAIRG